MDLRSEPILQLTDLLRRDRPQVQWEVKLRVDIFQVMENRKHGHLKTQTKETYGSENAFMFAVSAGDTSRVEPPLRVQDECGRQR